MVKLNGDVVPMCEYMSRHLHVDSIYAPKLTCLPYYNRHIRSNSFRRYSERHSSGGVVMPTRVKLCVLIKVT